MAKVYKIGDKVQVVANELNAYLGDPFHYYELGEIVRVVRVTQYTIECINPKGLIQMLKPTQIKLIERYKKGD